MNTPSINVLEAQSGRFVRENSAAVNIIDDYGSVKIITPESSAVHQALAFTHSSRNTLIIAGVAYLLFRTGVKPCHMLNNVLKTSEAPVQIDFFEDPTLSANGVALPIISRNRNQVGTSQSLVYGGPTVTPEGPQLSTDSIYGSNKAGGDMAAAIEWLLAPNTNYLFKVTNQSGKLINYAGSFDWLELPLPA